jgi:hypothetical protein
VQEGGTVQEAGLVQDLTPKGPQGTPELLFQGEAEAGEGPQREAAQ